MVLASRLEVKLEVKTCNLAERGMKKQWFQPCLEVNNLQSKREGLEKVTVLSLSLEVKTCNMLERDMKK